MARVDPFREKIIGPYKLRAVVAYGIRVRRRAITGSVVGRGPAYRRIEATRDGKYVFSWPRWRDAERWCKWQLRQ